MNTRNYYDFYQNIDNVYEKEGILTLNDLLRASMYDISKNHWVVATPIRHGFIKRLRYMFDNKIYMVKID